MSADSAGEAAPVVATWVSLPVLCHPLRLLATCSLSPAGQGVVFFSHLVAQGSKAWAQKSHSVSFASSWSKQFTSQAQIQGEGIDFAS